MKHVRLWATICLILTTTVALWVHHRYMRYERAYAHLRPGTPKGDVLRQFGKPNYTEGCHSISMWDGQPAENKSACVEEFRYFTRLRVGAWIVGFDANGKAVSKYYLSSP